MDQTHGLGFHWLGLVGFVGPFLKSNGLERSGLERRHLERFSLFVADKKVKPRFNPRDFARHLFLFKSIEWVDLC